MSTRKVVTAVLLLAVLVPVAVGTGGIFKTPGMEHAEKEARNPVRGYSEARPFAAEGIFVRDGKVGQKRGCWTVIRRVAFPAGGKFDIRVARLNTISPLVNANAILVNRPRLIIAPIGDWPFCEKHS